MPQRQTGFTLIELMIVVTIMGIAIGLVGPFTIEFVEKSRARDEVLQLERWLDKQKFEAFTAGETRHLRFEGKAVYPVDSRQSADAFSATEQIPLIVFEYVFFTPQQLTYYAGGFVRPVCLDYSLNGRAAMISLMPECNRVPPQ